jgi:AcrR family transcriptional regulator
VARYRAGIETEARIVDATRRLLGEVGLEGTTLKAICDRAHVRAGSFYNLFSSKEEVVLRVVGEAINAVDPDPEGKHTETLDDLVDAYIAFITGSPTLATIYLQVAVTGALERSRGLDDDTTVGKRVLRHHERRLERFAEAIVRGNGSLPGAHATGSAEVLIAALNGLAFRLLLEPSFDFPRFARLAAEAAR